jgi:hypothetical protein
MSWVGRAVMLAFVTVLNFILAVIYIGVGLPMIDIALSMQQGPFSSVFSEIKLVVPIVIGGLQLGTILWVIAGPVQRERSRRVRP